MALIFCRHGETVFNLEDKFQGISNSPLTEMGAKQAEMLRDFLKKNFNVKHFYLSPAKRVKQTYDIIAKEIHVGATVDTRLREVCYGEWETKPRKQINQTILKQREKSRFYFVHPGTYKGFKGESYADVFDRILSLLEELKKLDYDACVISHHGVMLCAYKYFYGTTEREINNLRISNTQVLIYDNKASSTVNLLDIAE